MARKKKTDKPKPCYPLTEVRALAKKDSCVVVAKAALKTAHEDFNWETNDIIDAILDLKEKHHYKRSVCYDKSNVLMDVYKAYNLKGENIYTHFYIDDYSGMLIIGSFKEI